MNRRVIAAKKTLALLSVGGTTFAFGLSNATCTSNRAITDFYTGVGNASIEAALDPAGAIGDDFDAILVQPTTGFLQQWWTAVIATTIPQDREFERLLIE